MRGGPSAGCDALPTAEVDEPPRGDQLDGRVAVFVVLAVPVVVVVALVVNEVSWKF